MFTTYWRIEYFPTWDLNHYDKKSILRRGYKRTRETCARIYYAHKNTPYRPTIRLWKRIDKGVYELKYYFIMPGVWRDADKKKVKKIFSE